MIGVTQTSEGVPFGNCVQASYATILGLDLNDVPRFDPASLNEDEDQREKERNWLNSIGYELIEITTIPNPLPEEVLNSIPPIPHLISGISPRGLGHRCVGIGGKLVWDPHPSRAGLDLIWSVGFLIPLDS